VDGYANLIAARLRKLAATEGTGMLPVSGAGAFFLHGGLVVHAESSRTSPPPMSPPPTGGLAALGLATELTVDAATELLSSESRYAKFRQSDVPFPGRARPIPVVALLAEVERRHHVFRQLAGVVTPDTPVVRNASPDWPRLAVSAPQWALVVGVGGGGTPRELALGLGRSVFATTIEIYRLITLGLLTVPANPTARAARPGKVMSFTRAIQNGRGSDA
jgi:hypothetical protein